MSEPPQPTTRTKATAAIEAVPAVARLTARAWLRGAVWGLTRGTTIAGRLARAAVDPDSAAELALEVRSELRAYAREFLGISELEEEMKLLMPPSGPLARRAKRNGRVPDEVALRLLGAELLAQAADVRDHGSAHPAYVRILTELAPDEARILRVIAVEGPQPLVDVRATNLVGLGSQLVAPGLNMIGAQAGVRLRDHVPAYLNNLHRLGLIWLSDEPLSDPITYQVLEAQPDVLQAIKETSRAKTIHRSIRLTPFGQDFCDICLPLDTAEIEELTAGD